MNIIKRIMGTSVMLRLFSVIIAFITNILINRSLGLELRGQYTTIIVYSTFIQLALNAGLCYAYPVLLKKYSTDAKEIMTTIIWIQTITYLIIGIGIGLFSRDYNTIMIVSLTLVLICNSQLMFLALIDDLKSRNILLIISSMIYMLINVYIYFSGNGTIPFVIISLIGKYVFEIWICSSKNGYFKFKIKKIKKSLLIDILKLGFPTVILAVLISSNYNIDIFLLDFMNSSDIQIGIFGVAYTLTNMLWVIPDAFKELIYNRSAKKNIAEEVLSLIIINVILCVVICFGFIIFGKLFLRIAYGEDYVIAYSVTVMLFIGVIPMVAFKLIHPLYVNSGNTAPVIKLLIISVLVNIIAALFLIPSYGALGAAISTVTSYFICSVLFVRQFTKDYNIDYNFVKEEIFRMKDVVKKLVVK